MSFCSPLCPSPQPLVAEMPVCSLAGALKVPRIRVLKKYILCTVDFWRAYLWLYQCRRWKKTRLNVCGWSRCCTLYLFNGEYFLKCCKYLWSFWKPVAYFVLRVWLKAACFQETSSQSFLSPEPVDRVISPESGGDPGLLSTAGRGQQLPGTNSSLVKDQRDSVSFIYTLDT